MFDRDVSRRIEEVIKVDQTDNAVVKEEIEEYVATAQIRRYYLDVLERFGETPNKPHEGIGIWISGFFGAGKSSFAKILGYVLENRSLGTTSAAKLFGRQTADPQIQALIATITTRIPARSIIFDVSTDQSVTDTSEKLTDILYRVLLRELGYATDRELAELEINLEARNRLAEFEDTFNQVFEGRRWDEVKHFPAFARNQASRVLNKMDPETYPNADTWARTPQRVPVSANFVARRAWELANRRAEGRALVFVVDEVGQYVARSTDKMLDLQGLVQALGREGKNRSSKWNGQVWLAVTSQERLSEVVDNLEGKQVELARLRDRFPIEVDLAPSDIREVTSKRILKKKPRTHQHLRDLFQEHSGKLREGTRLTGGADAGLDEDSFAELYPFLPFHVDLVIKIVSGLRTQRGATRHVGGANRTIIKLAQQVLINERTSLGSRPIGELVTLDLIYELLEGLISNERKHDVREIDEHFGKDTMATRAAKALALLEFVKDVPRSERNLAAVLHPSVEAAPIRTDVREALAELQRIHKVRATDDGWELLSRVGKDWEEERRGIEVFPGQRSSLVREVAARIFEEIPGYRHQNLKTFKVRPVLDGHPIGRRGDVELRIQFVTDQQALDSARDGARRESNAKPGKNALHWVVLLDEETVNRLDEVHRSRAMVRRYEPEHLSPEQSRLLSDEKSREARLRGRLTKLLGQTFPAGSCFLRGVHTPLAEFGDSVRDNVRAALQEAIPRLFPKFDLAAARVGTKDAVKILQSESMSGLPSVYYESGAGLGLIRHEAGRRVIVSDHRALTEVVGFIHERKSYGEDASGRTLEDRFTGFGYGWDLEALKLITATLFRDKKIEVYKGKRYTSYADPGVMEVFDNTQPFRSAKFVPRSDEGVGLDELIACHATLEQLYGKSPSLEEGAIASDLRKRMPKEVNRSYRALHQLRALELPGRNELENLIEALECISQNSVEDTILAFYNQRDSIALGLKRLRPLEMALSDTNTNTLKSARVAVHRLWPELRVFIDDSGLEAVVTALRARLCDSEFFHHLGDLAQRTSQVQSAYNKERDRLSRELRDDLQRHEDELRNQPAWSTLDEASRTSLLADFERVRARLEDSATPLMELVSHRRGLEVLSKQAVAELIRLTSETTATPGEGRPATPAIRRIHIRRFAGTGLRTENDMESALAALREACLRALSKGEIVVFE